MATPTTSGRGIRIRVSADTAKARQDIRKLDTSFKGVSSTAEKTTRNIAKLAAGIGAAFTGAAATRGINRSTDSFKDMENQIALVVGRGEELAKQMDTIYKISLKTKAPVAQTAEVFNRMGRALKEAGASTEDINRAVVALNKAAVISGGSVESQRAAMVQLGQGLAAGALRGEELNSVMEQMPRAAKAIADELGVGIGQLRAMAAEGAITSDVVFSAMLNQSEALNAEFDNIELTSSKAFMLLGDQIRRLTADISVALGITSTFTERFRKMAYYIDGNRESIVQSVVRGRDAIRGFTASLRELTDMETAMGWLSQTFSSTYSLAMTYLKPVEEFIRGWATRIIDYYFEIYDEVIGNSWWTDTMEETYDLAKDYLPKVEKRLGEFRDKAVNAFKSVYDYSKGAITARVDFEAGVQSLVKIKESIFKFVAEGIKKGIEATVGLSGEIRVAVTTALTAAFATVFGTGSLVKTFAKAANKIGPVFLLAIGAAIVEAVGSPGVFAAIGFMAGEVAGQLGRTIGAAIPDIIIGGISAAFGAVTGFFKEAGLIWGTVAGLTLLLYTSKAARSFAKDLSKNTFSSFLGGNNRKKGPIGDLVETFTNAKTAGTKFGTFLRGQFLGSVTAASVALNTMSLQLPAFAGAIKSKVMPALTTMSGLVGKLRLRTLGLAAAITLTAGSAFAGTGAESSGALSETMAMGLALAIPTLLTSSPVLKAIKKVGVGLGTKLGINIALGAVRGLLLSIGAGIAAAAAGIVAAITAPITLIIAGVAAVVATGGLLYLAIFGEGDSFREKFDNELKYVGRRLGLLNESTLSNANDVRGKARAIASRNNFGTNRFASDRNVQALENLNFQGLSDRHAGNIVDAVNELEAAENAFNAEQLRYGSASLEAQKRLEAAQRATTEAIRKGADSQDGQSASTNVVESALNNGNRLWSAGIRTWINEWSVFFGGEQSEYAKEREALRKMLEAAEKQDDAAVAITQLAGSLMIELGNERTAELIGQGATDVLKQFQLKNPEDVSPELANAAGNLIKELGEDFDRWWFEWIDASKDAITGNRDTKRALADFSDALKFNAKYLREKATREALSGATGALERAGLSGSGNLSRVDPNEAGVLSSLNNRMIALLERRTQLEGIRAKGGNPVEDAAAVLSIQLEIEDLEREIERAAKDALESGIAATNVDDLRDRLGGVVAGSIIDSLGTADWDGFGIGKTLEQLKEQERIIQSIEETGRDLTLEDKDRLVEAQKLREQLEQQLALKAQFVDYQSVEPQETEELLGEAVALSGLDIDLDKLYALDPDTIAKIATLTNEILGLRVASQLNLGGDGSALATAGVTAAEAAARVKAAIKELRGTLGGVKSAGGGSGETPISTILNRTGIAMQDLASLTAGEMNNIYASLKKIEEAEKAINKSGLDNVEMRKQQLAVIQQHNDAIETTLLGGSVGTAVAGGFDLEVLKAGPAAIETQQRINDLNEELQMTRASDYETIQAITAELDTQERKLERMTENGELFESFTGGLKGSISDALKTGDLSGAFHSFADSFSSTVIDTFVDSLVDALINEKALKSAFDGLFSEDMFKGIGDTFKGIFGGSGGGGNFISSILGFFGFSQGGVVPLTPNAQVGKDSVPALLKPGEHVLTTQEMRNGRGPGRGTQTTFNINVTGDVSRQTRQEIMDMIPTITRGVNASNHEANFNYR